VLTEVVFRFQKIESEAAREAIQQALVHRNTTQELQLPSAGCAFKNPVNARAGLLLDQAGLKGSRIGNAQVSRRHANFIVNLGNATCDDVLALMEHMQRCVVKTFGIWLEPEVRLIGERWTNGHG
jgi:UDP-N-acetylmuramate dehydrogenase